MIPSSKHLIGRSRTRTPKEHHAWEADRPGYQQRFKGWGLIGVKGTKPVWPITALREIQYIEEIMPGYNYLSLEGSVGYFSNPRFEKLGVSEFVLVLDRLNEARKDQERDLAIDYAHVIYLPEQLVKNVRQVDKRGALAFDALVQRAIAKPRP